MKKYSLFIFLTLFLAQASFAQHFDDFFLDKTLRIHYTHSGNKEIENFKLDSYHAGGKWHGTRAHLINPNQYGDVLFQAYDSLTNQLIYSQNYGTLFGEYRTSSQGEKEIDSFQECIRMPYPKKSIKYSFTSISRDRKSTLSFTHFFNPETERVEKFKKEFKTMNLHIGGESDKCLDILFIPDGYAKSDKKKLQKDMTRFASYVTSATPFKENTDKINIRAIMGYSEESGITDPGKNIYRNTLLNSSYNILEVDRYLMCLNVWRMNEVADDAPYDAIVLICNSPKYGGGGIYNFYATVNNEHDASAFVILHEMGHSIGGLGDEYYSSDVSVRDFFPEGVEPVEPNLTTLVDFESKWAEMLSEDIPIPTPNLKKYDNKVGVFEGGGYVAKGVYRPYRTCIMKENTDRFCPVCTKALINAFDYYSH